MASMTAVLALWAASGFFAGLSFRVAVLVLFGIPLWRSLAIPRALGFWPNLGAVVVSLFALQLGFVLGAIVRDWAMRRQTVPEILS